MKAIVGIICILILGITVIGLCVVAFCVAWEWAENKAPGAFYPCIVVAAILGLWWAST